MCPGSPSGRREPVVCIHPVDGEALSVTDGETVRLWNDLGEVTLTARLTPDIVPGTVLAPGVWWAKLGPDGPQHQPSHPPSPGRHGWRGHLLRCQGVDRAGEIGARIQKRPRHVFTKRAIPSSTHIPLRACRGRFGSMRDLGSTRPTSPARTNFLGEAGRSALAWPPRAGDDGLDPKKRPRHVITKRAIPSSIHHPLRACRGRFGSRGSGNPRPTSPARTNILTEAG